MSTPGPKTPTTAANSADPAPIYRSDVGPMVTLPTAQLAAAAIGGCALGAALAWVLLSRLSPPNLDAVVPAGLSAAGAHVVAILFERPWRRQRLGRWAFTLLNGSVISLLVSFALIVVLYSSSQLELAPLGLTTAGAWFIGNIAKVLTFGRFARAADDVSPEPSTSE